MSTAVATADLSHEDEEEEHLEHPDLKDYTGSKLGMWLFLYTEILLFGGLFLLFASYFSMYGEEFREGSNFLNLALGSVNTFVLLISSLTMGFSLTALKRGNIDHARFFLWITFFLALAFLVIKMFEWAPKFEHGIYPGSDVLVPALAGQEGPMMQVGGTHENPVLIEPNRGIALLYTLYFLMTGLHGFHVLVGMIFMIFIHRQINQGKIHKNDIVKLENCGLYWDLVHVVWVFLFPIFYLIRDPIKIFG